MRGHKRLLPVIALGVGLVLLLPIVLILTAPVQAAINSQINFQGKLTNSDGTNVTDGTYSIRFRIYNHPSNDAANACAANSCLWEETQGSVSVTDGIFQVALGSGTALPGSVDFNTSGLYLGVKVASDAEMTPRIQFTAAPYAFNSSALSGIASTGFVQLGQSASAQTDSSTNSGIFINKTGASGNILELQKSASSVFTIGNTGNITATGTYNTNTFSSSALTFGAAGAATIQSAAGQAINITGHGNSTVSTDAGSLAVSGFTATSISTANSATGATGAVSLLSGNATVSGNTGGIALTTGNSAAGTAGSITLDVGTSNSGNGSILIGTATRAQTITIGNTTGGAIRVGQNGGTVQIDGTNIDVSTAGVVTVAGAQTKDITSSGTNALTVDTGGAAAFNLGTASATSIGLGRTGVTTTNNGAFTSTQLLTGNAGATVSGGAVSLTGNAASSLTTSSGALTVTSAAAATWSTGAGTLTIQAGGGTVSLGSSTTLTANAGLSITSNTTNALTLDSGSTGAINIGTNANAKTITIGNSTGATAIAHIVGSGTNVFNIQGASSAVYMQLDTTNNRFYVGNPTADTTAFLLVLDYKNTTGDPTGINGGSYYNSANNKFRCFQNSIWMDCGNGFNTITKAADQAATQSSTAFQDDNTLTFPVNANTTYVFDAWVPVNDSNATADLKYTFTTPTGAIQSILTSYYSTATATVQCNIITSGQTCANTTVNRADHFIQIKGHVTVAGTAGNVTFRFAQNGATAASFPVIKKGATLSWHQSN